MLAVIEMCALESGGFLIGCSVIRCSVCIFTDGNATEFKRVDLMEAFKRLRKYLNLEPMARMKKRYLLLPFIVGASLLKWLGCAGTHHHLFCSIILLSPPVPPKYSETENYLISHAPLKQMSQCSLATREVQDEKSFILQPC
ncbi:hypothetical protein RJT34_24367 [Clitoria ternatea]|uniref:Uncharacterized protein n=1 Tax=Clitoria ternatea TaxID=43366 RepID=A0AAN9FPJ2_CLITE